MQLNKLSKKMSYLLDTQPSPAMLTNMVGLML